MPDILTQLFMIIAPIMLVIIIVLTTAVLLAAFVVMLVLPVFLGYIVIMFGRDEAKIQNDKKITRLQEETRWETERLARVTQIQDARRESNS